MKQLAGLAVGTIALMIVIAELVPRYGADLGVDSAGGQLAAFINSLVIGVATVAAVMMYAKQRPIGTPITWGEAMVGAVYAFAMFTIGYGVIPDLWIRYAEAGLRWDDKARLLRTDDATWGIVKSLAGQVPFDINYIHVRDVIVIVLYGVAIGVNIWIWAFWQSRGKTKVAVEPVSDFGRPLVREA